MKLYSNTEEKMTIYQIYADRAKDKAKEAHALYLTWEYSDDEKANYYQREETMWLECAYFYEKEIKEMLLDIEKGVD